MDQITTTLSPLVIDIILAVIILLVACLRAKAGLYHCVTSILVIILALAIGLVGSKLLTPTVKDIAWEKYSKTVEKNFDEEVSSALEGDKSLGKSFRDNWNRVVSSFGSEKASEALEIEEQIMDYTDEELVAKVRAFTLLEAELLTLSVVKLGLFGVCAAIALLVLTLIKNIIGKLAEIKLVSWINHLGGFVLGAVEAIVILIVIIRGATLLNITIFNELSEGTILLKWFIGGDLQATIQSLQTITVEDLKNIKLEDLTTVNFDDVGSQVKELINSIDTSKLPSGVTDAVDQLDVNQITEDTKGIVDSVKDVVNSIDTEKIENSVKDLVKDGAKDVILNVLK